MNALVRGAALWLAIAVVAGCGDGGADGGLRVNDLPALAVAEELRIGSLDDPDEGFTAIVGVAPRPDGRLYVLEGRDQQIRIYDPEGNRIGTIGGRGEGPGEFTGAYLFGFKGDTLWVNDRMQQRVTMLTEEGEVISTFPVGTTRIDVAEGVFGQLYAGELRADGLLGSTPTLAFLAGASVPDTLASLPKVLFDRKGRVVDTAGSIPWPLGSFKQITVAGQRVYLSGAPSDKPLAVPFPDGSALIEWKPPPDEGEAVFTVTRVLESGDTVYHRALRYTPETFSPAFVDTLIWRSGSRLLGTTSLDSAAIESAFRKEFDLPPFAPPVAQALAGHDGSLWLRRQDDGGPVHRWLVLAPSGEPSGRLELPRSARPLWLSTESTWAVVTDDLDIPWLVRYRIEG